MNKNIKKFLAFFIFFNFLTISTSSAKAETVFNVNSATDATDVSPGNGICETAPGNGICTLRAAIQETNALPGSDTIELPAGDYSLTLAGQNEDLSATGDLDIRGSLKIIGTGAELTKINGNLDRVFDIMTGAETTVELDKIQIRNGLINALGWQHGAGIRSSGNILKITNSIIRGNRITDSQYAPSYGGGIYASNNQLVITDSEISGNTVESMRWAGGAGIISTGNLIIEKSTVKDNYVQSGSTVDSGGIWIKSGTFLINDSTIYNNTATAGYGGGILQGVNASGTITNSLISYNNAGIGGGISSSGNLTITNTTITGNQARGGGAIYFSSNTYGNPPLLSIINSTIYNNYGSGYATEAIDSIYYSYSYGYSDQVKIVNSIISARTNRNCNQLLTSLGHNLSSDTSCGLTNQGDLQNQYLYPYLSYLQDNGGPTLTHALLQNSPAIDNANPTYCPPTDQRGIARPQGPQCDIGAYEAEPFNRPPIANAEADQTINEGQQVTFNGSGSTDPDGVSDIVSYGWDFGDGVSTSGQTVNHTYSDNGTYTAILTVTDSQGEFDTDTATITVNNVSPTAIFSLSPQTILQGNSSTASFGNQFDPSSIDTLAGFTYSYDCTNDGVFESVDSASPSFTCFYPFSGLYAARGRITDKDGGFTDYTASITVQTPSEAINDLVDLVQTYNLQQGISNSLDAKLDAALGALDDINQNNNQAAINSLQAFISAVEAQRGIKITNEQADALIAAAQAIISSIL